MSLAIIPKAPVRRVQLHLASTKEGLKDDNFVVLPPKRKDRLQAIHFADGTAVRREIGIVNQMCPRECVQLVDPETGKPKYHLNDPLNSVGL